MTLLRVLIIEDSENDALLITDHLRRGGFDPQSRAVDDLSDLEPALAEEWDVIISDYVLSDFTGLDALELARKMTPDTPFVIVSGKMGEDVAVDTMKAGAHDYILKSNLARLAPAIERELREAQVRRERKASQRELENALERERHFSLFLQRALLPSEPRVGPGYDVAAEYAPVYASREIGGDFYDVFRVGDCRVGVLIGDVSGKGLEAAAMAATTRSTIHAFVHETASAAEVLARTNTVLYSRSAQFDSFATVFLVIIDLRTSEINYSSAGHPPAMICRSDDTVELLHYGQMPLAIMDVQSFEEHHISFEPGDKLVLYTDGISEARRGPDMLDIEGIERILANHSNLPASELAHTLLSAATEWANGKLTDDAAVVVVERQPVSMLEGAGNRRHYMDT